MTNKYFIIVLLIGLNLFSNLSTFAQQIEVNYIAQAKHIKSPNENTDNFTKEIARITNNIYPHLRFKAVSDGFYNKFYCEEALTSDFDGDLWLKPALTLALDGKQIFSDYSNSKSYYESEGISKIRYVNIENVTWSITQESKLIMGYLCYKATATILDSSLEEKHTPPTIAWFTSQLNFRGGPTAYATLPGLILELHNSKMKFTAISIKHKKESSLILPDYDSKDILSHKEWNAYFSANNPISRLKN